MAFLWWHSERRNFRDEAGVDELKFVIANLLTQNGFSNVRHSDLEIAGGKDGAWVSIAHFQIADRQYWEVTMTAGDTPQTQATNNEVVALLEGIQQF